MSQPDKPVGRKKVITPTMVSQWAKDNAAQLYRPVSKEDIFQAVSDWAPDLGVTVAYGRILTPEVLALPEHGWWNVHFSLLPGYRGAAPVQRALLAGDTVIGVSVFQLDEGLDTGPLLAQVTHPIAESITAEKLLAELAVVGADLLGSTLRLHLAGGLSPVAQEGEPSTAPTLHRDEGRIRATDSLDRAMRRFQAATPEPGCFVHIGHGKRTIRVLKATPMARVGRPGDGQVDDIPEGVGVMLAGGDLVLHRVQPAGKKPMDAMDWWRGVHERVVIDG